MEWAGERKKEECIRFERHKELRRICGRNERKVSRKLEDGGEKEEERGEIMRKSDECLSREEEEEEEKGISDQWNQFAFDKA